jgi:hypothetical protein
MRDHRTQDEVDLLSVDDSGSRGETTSADAQLERKQRLEIILLAAERDPLAVRLVVERRGPVDRAKSFLDFPGGETRGVKTADDRPHAGSDDVIDRDAQLFHDLEHTDVGRAPRPTAGKHETDPGSRALVRLRSCEGHLPAGQHRDAGQCGDPGQIRERRL